LLATKAESHPNPHFTRWQPYQKSHPNPHLTRRQPYKRVPKLPLHPLATKPKEPPKPLSHAGNQTKEPPTPRFTYGQPYQKTPQKPTSPDGKQSKKPPKFPPHLRATNPKSFLPKNTLNPTSLVGNKTKEVPKSPLPCGNAGIQTKEGLKSPLHLRAAKPKSTLPKYTSNPHLIRGNLNQRGSQIATSPAGRIVTNPHVSISPDGSPSSQFHPLGVSLVYYSCMKRTIHDFHP
jgi:hypothetical protein